MEDITINVIIAIAMCVTAVAVIALFEVLRMVASRRHKKMTGRVKILKGNFGPPGPIPKPKPGPSPDWKLPKP